MAMEHGILRGLPASGGRGRELLSAEDRKENARPRGFRRPCRSPLPSWFPRTPLRDITVVVNALERRRNLLRAARCQRNNGDPIVPHTPASPISVLEHGPCKSEASCSSPQAPVSLTISDSDTKSPLSVTSTCLTTAVTDGPVDFDKKKYVEEPDRIVKEHTDVAADLENKKKFIEELQRAVKEHLKSLPVAPVQQRRSSLLMMR